METVTNLDEDDTDVIAHGEQELLEVLCLCRSLVAEDTATDLGQSIDNLCYLGTEDIGDVFHRVVGVFHHVVQEGSADAGRTEPHLLAGYLSHGDRVHDVRLSGETAHTLVSLACKVERLGHDIYFLAVT